MSNVFVIADPGATWRIPGEPWTTSSDRMYALVRDAARAGADAFKPQFYRADKMYPKGSAEYRLLKQYELPEEWLPRLAQACVERGVEWACTVYTPEHVPLIDPLVKRHKIASFEVGHEALMAALIQTGKPILVSFGMGQFLPHTTNDYSQVVPLHCVSSYPAAPEQMNLAILRDWEGPKGLSDHSRGHTAAVMAIALGATVIEKHIRADDTPKDNPDYAHSQNPGIFGITVEYIREAEVMLGDGKPGAQTGELTHYRYNPETGLRGTK